ncbi:hypothetical protein Q3G72_017306 [Acer saccharum]|nr:hypothetical protein Q3G72_017306 [Acer saccharum]
MGWQTYTSTPPRFCRRIVEEFNARMIPEDYRHPASVMVHGREVDLIMVDINRRATVDLSGERLEPPPVDIGITRRKVLEDEHYPTRGQGSLVDSDGRNAQEQIDDRRSQSISQRQLRRSVGKHHKDASRASISPIRKKEEAVNSYNTPGRSYD